MIKQIKGWLAGKAKQANDKVAAKIGQYEPLGPLLVLGILGVVAVALALAVVAFVFWR